MPTWQTFDAFAKDLVGLADDLTGPEKQRITRQMGVEAQRITDRSATRSLGTDRAFSGWNRNAPIPLDTRLRGTATFDTLLTPTRSSAGPWTVAQSGRNQGNAAGFSGPGINIRTGSTARTRSGAVRRTRARAGRRWNGATAGKGTAERALVEMNRELPAVAGREVLKVTRKRFDVT